MSNYYQTILESSRRCAVATQEVAGNARSAADQISVQAIELEAMAKEAADRAVEAEQRVKDLEAKVVDVSE